MMRWCGAVRCIIILYIYNNNNDNNNNIYILIIYAVDYEIIYGAALLGPPSPLWFPVVWVPCPSPLWLRSAAPASMAIAGWASEVRLLRVWTLGCDTVPTCPELQSQ